MSLEPSPVRARGPGRPRREELAPVENPGLYLTREELAKRWRTTPVSISRIYRKLGLRPLTVQSKLLFSVQQVAEVEQQQAK